MKRLIVFVLFIAAMSVEVNAEPRIEVYEIRKTKDNRDVDTHYFDPDELRQDDYIQTFTNKKTNSKLIKQLTQLLSDGQRISDVSHSKTKKYKMDLNELLSFIKSGDDGHTLRDDDGSDFEDYTRSNPIVLLSLGSDEQPQDATAFGKLQRSPLRSQYYDVEDRTAPPRLRRPYDDDY